VTQTFVDYQTHRTKNRLRIIDAYFQRGALSMLLSVLPINRGNNIIWEGDNYAALCFPIFQDQMSLTLC